MSKATLVVVDGVSYPLDDTTAVDFSEAQSLTAAEKQQARDNIGAGTGEVSEAELTEKLADKADVIVDTASGAIASLPDGAAAPAKGITIGIEPVQAGSGDPSPDNVRPITGWTGAEVARTGKNLCERTVMGYIADDYNLTIDGNSETLVFYAKEGKTYTASSAGTFNRSIISGVSTNEITQTVHLTKKRIQLGSQYTWTATWTGWAVWYVKSVKDDTVKSTAQIELGSTATDYEPYQGESITIPFGQTVYGGTLDVVNGVLTVDRAMVDISADWQWSQSTAYPGGFYTYGQSHEYKEYTQFMCSHAKTVSGISEYIDGTCYCDYSLNFRIMSATSTVQDWKDYIIGQMENGTPIQIAYELATPITYQLTPVEIEMLLGDNNVWADTGDTTVTYRADTKLYIQKINTPTDDDMIADAQIASGKYFIVGGNLYKSTTTIPAGDAINPGSNCILTNLANALNALNT